MTPELWMLAIAAALQFTLVAIHGIHISVTAGIAWGVGRRDTPVAVSDLGRRIERTLINTMESLAIFIPLILTIQLAGFSSPLVVLSGSVYLAARAVFALLYLGNVPYVRTGVWLTAMFCLLFLGYSIVTQLL
jgi:uncharacterized MAPEG superfamily protein